MFDDFIAVFDDFFFWHFRHFYSILTILRIYGYFRLFSTIFSDSLSLCWKFCQKIKSGSKEAASTVRSEQYLLKGMVKRKNKFKGNKNRSLKFNRRRGAARTGPGIDK